MNLCCIDEAQHRTATPLIWIWLTTLKFDKGSRFKCKLHIHGPSWLGFFLLHFFLHLSFGGAILMVLFGFPFHALLNLQSDSFRHWRRDSISHLEWKGKYCQNIGYKDHQRTHMHMYHKNSSSQLLTCLLPMVSQVCFYHVYYSLQ